jgi:DnaJ-class molecular chaperone
MNRSAAEASQLLGIPRDSDRNTIAHAYRELARTVHPDVSSDADAAERFASLAEAYRIATTAPARPRVVRTGDPVPVRRPRPGPQSTQQAPIVAGPVRIRPSSVRGKATQ